MRRFAMTPTVFLLALAFVGCSSSDEASSDSANNTEQDLDDLTDDLDELQDDLEQDPGDAPDVEAPTFLLTGSVDAPDGWVEDPSNCAEPEKQGPPYFTYYVPAEWNRVGSGHGGSGAVGGTGDHNYDLGTGKIEIEVDEDNYDGDEVQNTNSPEAWTTWDYETTTYSEDDEVTTQITYEALDAIDIDGESVDLFYLDESQSDDVSGSEYKARVIFGEVPSMGSIGSGNGRRPASATVTFTWRADEVDFTVEEVAEILSTFRVSDCAQEGITETYEMLFGTDFSD